MAQPFYLPARVKLAGHRVGKVLEAENPQAPDLDVHLAILVPLYYPEQFYFGAHFLYLVIEVDGQPESGVLVKAVIDQLAIAGLKNVEIEFAAWVDDQVEGKKREHGDRD
jgi:hypothetical protein